MDRSKVAVRTAEVADAPIVVQFLREMLQELASMGGHPASRDREQWARLQNEIQNGLQEPSQLHLLAETAGLAPVTVGWAYARIVDREPVYEPARMLHISALFVSRPYRKEGIGQTLLEALLGWGRDSGCTEAELNVLVNNPARALYEELGFNASHIKMARRL
jgi:GNAT superfamily N-acetyltransferase